jgi:hypothetical protein
MVPELSLGTMIVLNVMEMIKFMLDSVTNYVSVLVLMMLVFFLLTSFVSIVVDKVTNMVGILKSKSKPRIDSSANSGKFTP